MSILLGPVTGRCRCPRRARDRPDEAGEFSSDRSDGNRLELAPSDQRSVAPVQAALRFPSNLANRLRHGIDLCLLLFAHARRMLIAPGALHLHAPRPSVAGLGDRTALDLLAGRVLRRYQPEIGHQLAWRLKARE